MSPLPSTGAPKSTIAGPAFCPHDCHAAIPAGANACVMSYGDGSQALNQRQVLGELWLLEAGGALPPVVVRKALDPLPRHGAGQQSRPHRRVDDHADSLALAERQNLVLRFAVDQRVWRLQRLDGGDCLSTLQLFDAEVRDADVACEALSFELGQRGPTFLDLLVGGRPVDLVEVDRVEPEPRKAALELAPERVALQALERRAA